MKTAILKPATALFITSGAIATCEILTRPNPAAFGLLYFALNYLPVLVLFLLIFACTNRLVFSSLASSAAAVLIVAVSNAKYAVLGKPLMPSDFMLVPHLVQSPDLYLRYMNLTSALCVLGAVLALAVSYRSERDQLCASTGSTLLRFVFACAAFSFFTGITDADSFVAKTYDSSSLKYSSWDPRSSVYHSGLFYTFIRMSEELDYSIPDSHGNSALVAGIAGSPLSGPQDAKPAALPDIVVVQNESFYDLRQHDLEIRGNPYASWDKAALKSSVSGSVKVPGVGGNTAKTEFSFLTGIEGSVLPCDYPYRFLVKRNVWSLPWYLKSLGYRTIAIHPYSRTFWDRNIAFGFLGFDRFIDGREFSAAQKEGIYVSDKAVAEKIASVLSREQGPVFVFAVTMENHGPWDRKRVANRRRFPIKGATGTEDEKVLGRYLHHVVNAGDMARDVIVGMERSKRPGLLAFYGDHAPGFCGDTAKIPLRPGSEVTDTPYLVWKNFGPASHARRDLSVSFLASEILELAGLNGDSYFRANSYARRTGEGTFGKLGSDELNRSYTQLLYDNLSGKLPDAHFVGGKMLADYGEVGRGENAEAPSLTLPLRGRGLER